MSEELDELDDKDIEDLMKMLDEMKNDSSDDLNYNQIYLKESNKEVII